MLEFLQGKASCRKLRLFNCHCCRRLNNVIRGERNSIVLAAAEEFAEGLITSEEMESRSTQWFDFDYPFPLAGTWQRALHLATMTDSEIRTRLIAATAAISSGNQEKEKAIQANLLRDIFGPLPFRPVTFDPSLLTSSVLALAAGIYSDKAFDPMPILADALQDAGCDNEEILNHCRGESIHVRGCFVVDALLKKS
jgi:hypothetical protein